MAQEPRQVTELELLRLLAQPVRRRINELLRQGPASATTLAHALGESTGLTSYHLRELARFGLVEEVPELARGRERWWRAARVDLRFPPRSQQSPEQREAFDHLERTEIQDDLAAFRRFEQARERLGPWGDALLFSRGNLRLTPEELLAFFEDYIALLKRYDRPDKEVPDDARLILARFVAFPAVAEEDVPP
jgi:DNA-binding transcriptional ArsR family regulator